MRRLVCAAFVSLDGVMQAPGAPEEDPTGGFGFGGWVFPYWDEILDAATEPSPAEVARRARMKEEG